MAIQHTYNGGKSGSGTYQQIINLIPPHSIYVAPFAGHDGVFRKIRRAPVSVLNDIDARIIEAWGRYHIPGCDVVQNFMQGNLFEKPLRPVVILSVNDYSVILDRFYDNPEAFIFCDPPYPMDKRRSQQRLYNFDWEGPEYHIRFLERIRNITANCMVCSYENDIYNEYLGKWNTHKYMSMTRAGLAEEIIYFNYPAPFILHDFSYLGNNYRERDRIKRKVSRHIARLDRLPGPERTGILSAIISKFKDTSQTLIKL